MSKTRGTSKENKELFQKLLKTALANGQGASTRHEAVKLINAHMRGSGGLLKGIQKVLEGTHHLDGGLALVDLEGRSLSVHRPGDARGQKVRGRGGRLEFGMAELPSWLHGLMKCGAPRGLAEALDADLAKMRAAGTAADGDIWKDWGHHEADKSKGARAPSTATGGVPTKRAFLPPDSRRFAVLPPEERAPELRGAAVIHMPAEWVGMTGTAVEAMQEAIGFDDFPTFESDLRRTQRDEPQVSPASVAVFDKHKDIGVNINHMPARGYYPFHTDDRATAKQMPDIDGSGHHILTYSERPALVLVSPSDKAKLGTGCVGLVVKERELWGMRSLCHVDAVTEVAWPHLVREWNVRDDAVHAVLNTSDSPRFSVNFRLGGFDKVFEVPTPVPKATNDVRGLEFEAAGKRTLLDPAKSDSDPKRARLKARLERLLETNMVV